MLAMDHEPANHRRAFQGIGRASRRFVKMFWSTMCSCHRPEQANPTSSALSASPRGPTRASLQGNRPELTNLTSPSPPAVVCGPIRATSPPEGISYNRVSQIIDVDYLRSSMNADGFSQSGYTEMLRVMNPDPSSRSNSELSGSMTAARADTEMTTPCLPDLYFVSSPEPSLSCVMALSYDILTNMLRDGAIPLPARRSASSFTIAESPPRGTHSLSSLGESPVPSVARIVTWNTVPRELFFTPLGPESDRQQPANRRSNHSSNTLTRTRSTSIPSDGHSTLFASSVESLIDLVDRFHRQWSRSARPCSDRASKGSSRISATSSAALSGNRKLSWSWGLFLSVDSLPTMPIVLAAANVAQKRRLHRRLVRRALS